MRKIALQLATLRIENTTLNIRQKAGANMKKILYYLIPLCFVAFVLAIVVPHKTQYKKTLYAICLPSNISNLISNFEPIEKAAVTLDMERKEYLLIQSNTVKGGLELPILNIGGDATGTIQYVTEYWAGSILERNEYENEYEQKYKQAEPIFSTILYHWNAEEKRDWSIRLHYNADMNKLLIHDSLRGKTYFCSEEETDLEELLEYFEGYYEVAPELKK